jgi:hypothetical protein
VGPGAGGGARGLGRDLVVVGSDEPRLRPFDLGRDLGREQTALAAPARQHRHEKTRLAVEELRHRPVVVLAAAPELRERDGVERTRHDLAPDPEPCQPIAELAGGLAREGDGEGVLGVDVGVPGLPGDATGQDARLARAGAGEDRQRNCARGDGLTLRVIEALEQRVLEQLVIAHSWTIPTGYDSNRGSSLTCNGGNGKGPE